MAAARGNKYAQRWPPERVAALVDAMIELVDDDAGIICLVQVLAHFRMPRKSWYDIARVATGDVSHKMGVLGAMLEAKCVAQMRSGELDFRVGNLILRRKRAWLPAVHEATLTDAQAAAIEAQIRAIAERVEAE